MKKALLFLVILATFSLVFTGCPKVNEPDPINNPDDVPQGKEFVRIHKGGEYDGFVEIYFDNYQEQIVKSRNVNVYRKKANTEEWVYLYHFEDSTMLSSLPAVIDYHAEKNVQYSYYLWFNDWYGWEDESISQTITSKANLPKFKFTQGEASYNASTMELTFKTLPELDYSPIEDDFDSTWCYVIYSDSFSFEISELSDNTFHVRNSVAKNYKSCLGKTLSPVKYQLGICKYIGTMHYNYWIFEPITQLPSLPIPSELPDIPENERFVRKHVGGEYDGFTEIYFDNYENELELLKPHLIYIRRVKSDGSWQSVYSIYTNNNSNLPKSLPPVIDYYADKDTEYSYQIEFYLTQNNNYYYEHSPYQIVTTTAGLGEISVTQGNATFDNATGILTFSTLPEINYQKVNGFFDQSHENLLYFYNNSINFELNDISNNQLNIYAIIANYWNIENLFGKLIKPDTYFLDLSKSIDNYFITYHFDEKISGLPEISIPNKLPEIPIPETERFVRKHVGGEYDGFTEIYFDNYEEEILKSSQVYVQRKNADGGWEDIINIMTNWDGNTNPKFTESLPSVIDYYTDKDTEYTYRLLFYNYDNSTGNNFHEYSASQTFTSEAGFGKLTVTKGSASFNDATGMLSFSILPVFNYVKVSGYFDEQLEQFYFVYPDVNGNRNMWFYLNDIQNSELNVYKIIDNNWDRERILGKKLTPEGYSLQLIKILSNYTISYDMFFDITGLPEIDIPSEIPFPETERFVRKHVGGEYDGFTEIYFDNYEEQILQADEVYVDRKNDTDEWITIWRITRSNYSNPTFTEMLPELIDYYIEENARYTYRLNFNNYHNGNQYHETTLVQSITAEKSLNNLNVTQGEATFNTTTGVVTFTAIPEITISEIEGYETSKEIYFRESNYQGGISININDIISNKFNVYNHIQNNYHPYIGLLGKTFNPIEFEISLNKYLQQCYVTYVIYKPVTSGMPVLTIPDSLPAE